MFVSQETLQFNLMNLLWSRFLKLSIFSVRVGYIREFRLILGKLILGEIYTSRYPFINLSQKNQSRSLNFHISVTHYFIVGKFQRS